MSIEQFGMVWNRLQYYEEWEKETIDEKKKKENKQLKNGGYISNSILTGEFGPKLVIKSPQNNLEIDYTKLKPGMIVKLKTWEKLCNEYKMDKEGDILIDDMIVSFFYDAHTLGKKYKIYEVTEDCIFIFKCSGFDYDDGYSPYYARIMPLKCIEKIINTNEQK